MSEKSEQPAAGPAPGDEAARNLEHLARQAEAEQQGEGGEYRIDHNAPAGPGEPGPDPQGVELCATLAQVGFEIQAARKGAHWRLAEEETKALAEPLAAVLEKYAPGVSMGPEAALVLAAGMIVAPRMMMDRKIQAEREKEKRAERERAEREGAAATAGTPKGVDDAGED